MCLLVNRNQTITSAEEDLVCYKVVYKTSGKYAALHHYFFYKDGETYKRQNGIRILNGKYVEGSYRVEQGFHSYVNIEDAKDEQRIWNKGRNNVVVIKCIIPKGGKYVKGFGLNGTDNYVSETIKILGEV